MYPQVQVEEACSSAVIFPTLHRGAEKNLLLVILRPVGANPEMVFNWSKSVNYVFFDRLDSICGISSSGGFYRQKIFSRCGRCEVACSRSVISCLDDLTS